MEVEHAPVVDTAGEEFSMEAVEAEDLEDSESSIEESEVKLRGGGLSERDESVAEAGHGGMLSAG
jgi:hypothetical protein